MAVFCGLIASDSLPGLYRNSNITPIPKGSSPSQFPLDYRPILMTPIISKAKAL